MTKNSSQNHGSSSREVSESTQNDGAAQEIRLSKLAEARHRLRTNRYEMDEVIDETSRRIVDALTGKRA